MYGTRRRGGASSALEQPEPQQAPRKASVWEKKFNGHTLGSDLAMLGLHDLPKAVEIVMQQWRAQVKAKFAEPGFDMDLLKQARDRLMLAIDKGAHERINQLNDSSCKICGGSGRIGVGFGRECPTCKGTGNV